MTGLFTIQNLMTLGMLVVLQAVLGFDNLLYVSLESKRVAEDKQQFVRRLGIGLANRIAVRRDQGNRSTQGQDAVRI